MGYRVRFGVNITVPMPTLMSIPNANWIFGHEDMTTVKHEMGIAPKDGMIYPSSTWQWEIPYRWTFSCDHHLCIAMFDRFHILLVTRPCYTTVFVDYTMFLTCICVGKHPNPNVIQWLHVATTLQFYRLNIPSFLGSCLPHIR